MLGARYASRQMNDARHSIRAVQVLGRRGKPWQADCTSASMASHQGSCACTPVMQVERGRRRGIVAACRRLCGLELRGRHIQALQPRPTLVSLPQRDAVEGVCVAAGVGLRQQGLVENRRGGAGCHPATLQRSSQQPSLGRTKHHCSPSKADKLLCSPACTWHIVPACWQPRPARRSCPAAAERRRAKAAVRPCTAGGDLPLQCSCATGVNRWTSPAQHNHCAPGCLPAHTAQRCRRQWQQSAAAGCP